MLTGIRKIIYMKIKIHIISTQQQENSIQLEKSMTMGHRMPKGPGKKCQVFNGYTGPIF